MENISIMIRMDKDKVEQLKKLSREIAYNEGRDTTFNNLIVEAVYKQYEEYFNNGEKEK
jgi:hypothetical protein